MKVVNDPSGVARTSFRVMDGLREDLEAALRLRSPALLILSNKEVEGTIVQYSADIHSGYEIMIETERLG